MRYRLYLFLFLTFLDMYTLLYFFLFIQFWLLWVFVAVCGLSLVTRAGDYSLVGLALASHCGDFSCCRAQAQGAWASGVAACRLRNCALLALGYPGVPSCGTGGLISLGSWALECRLGSCDAWTGCSEACEISLDQ